MWVNELFAAIMDYAVATGTTRIDLLPGCWEKQISDECWIAMNGHKEPVKTSKGLELHPYQIAIEWHGWPAGIVEPSGGTIMACWGEENGEDLLIEHFREAARALIANEPPDVDCYTLPNGDCITPNCRLHSPKEGKR